jgi:3-deoxy-manno-octulosonate cytidylyltransferase (CMP-KDO synthetase)
VKKNVIVGVIPARYKSTRLPGKPLLDIAGKPMIQHTYEHARKAALLDRVIVATDDERIVAAVKQFGGEVVLTRDNVKTGTDRIALATKPMECDIVVNIQGDEPLIHPEMIDAAIQPLISDESIQVSTLVRRIETVWEFVDIGIPKVVFDKNNFALYFTRAIIPFMRDEQNVEQWLKKFSYYKHIGLYVYRKDFLMSFTEMEESSLEKTEKLEQLRILENGYKIKCVVTEHDSISVDTKEDLERVREMLHVKIRP